MKYAVERVSMGKGEYNFMARIDKDGHRYNAVYSGWAVKAGEDEYVAGAIGDECLRFKSLKEASEAVKLAIGKVLELNGFCDKAELVKSVEDFDNV